MDDTSKAHVVGVLLGGKAPCWRCGREIDKINARYSTTKGFFCANRAACNLARTERGF